MEKIIEIKLSEEDTIKLQKANYEAITFGENLKFMMENVSKGFSADHMAEYSHKKAEADVTFDQTKYEVEKKYLPAEMFGKCNYDWTVDFRLCLLRLKLLDEKAIKLAEKIPA